MKFGLAWTSIWRKGVSPEYVSGEWRALSFADELMRHSDKRQLLETDEAHRGVYKTSTDFADLRRL